MPKVRALVGFYDAEHEQFRAPGDEFEMSDERITALNDPKRVDALNTEGPRQLAAPLVEKVAGKPARKTGKGE